MWVLPSSPVFAIIRPDLFKCDLFKECFKNITISEFDREEKSIVFRPKEPTSTERTFYYVNTRKGTRVESGEYIENICSNKSR